MAVIACPKCNQPNLQFFSRFPKSVQVAGTICWFLGIAFVISIFFGIYFVWKEDNYLSLFVPFFIGVVFLIVPSVARAFYTKGETRCQSCGYISTR